jgi:indolepyruvate decarboxylase
MTTLLFAYGTLIPRDDERLASEGWVADAVRGRLYDLGAHPGLVDLDDPSAGWVEGYVRPVTLEELEGPLDRYEDVDSGLFRRVRTTTRLSRDVWLYLYSRPLPPESRGPLDRWTAPEGMAVTPSVLHGPGGHE